MILLELLPSSDVPTALHIAENAPLLLLLAVFLEPRF